MTSTREKLQAKSARRYADVTLPDGETVRIQSLSAGDESDIELSMFDLKTGKMNPVGLKTVKFQTVARSLVEADTNERVYGDEEWEEIRNLDDAIVDCIHKACIEMRAPEKTPEDFVKNSE